MKRFLLPSPPTLALLIIAAIGALVAVYQLALLQSAAGLVGLAVALAAIGLVLLRRLTSSRTEAIEKALAEQSRILNTVMSSSPDLIWAKDRNGRMTLANPATLALLGPEAKVIGRDVRDLAPDPEQARTILENDERIMRSGVPETVEEEFGPSGRELVFSTSKAPLRDASGEVVGVLGISRDITESKRIDNAIRASEERLRLALEATGSGTWEWCPAESNTHWDQRVRAIFGIPQDLTITLAVFNNLVHPDDRKRQAAALAKALDPSGSGTYSAEYRIRRYDTHEERWVASHAHAHFSDGQVVRLIGTTQDITDRKRVEQAQLKSERLFNTVLENASVALFLMDERQQCVFMNAAAEKLTGYTLEEVKGRALHNVLHHTRPDGRPYPIDECPIDRAFPQNNQEQGEEIFVHKDGSFYPVAYTASPIRDEMAAIVGTIIEVRDIRQEKQAQAEIGRFARALDLAPAFIRSLDGNVIYWSEGMRRLYGYTREEAVGRLAQDLLQSEFETSRAEVTSELLAHGTWQGEIRNRRKDGAPIVVMSSWALQPGNPPSVVIVHNDITEMKAHEEHLRFVMGELSHRSKNLLAVIQAMARQTAAASKTIEDFDERFTGRVQALARLHDILVHEDWQGASMLELVQAQLAPFASLGSSRVEIRGPAIYLTPAAAQNIALALHELATNAAKYGALSNTDGKILVEWETVGTNSYRRVRLTWRESGGPPVDAPSQRGFGRVVIERLTAQALSGEVSLDYRPDGVVCTFDFPAESSEARVH